MSTTSRLLLLRPDEPFRTFLFVLLFLILLVAPPALLPPLDLLLRPDELRGRLLPPLFLLCLFRSIESPSKSLSSNSINSESKSTTSRLLLLRPDERLLFLWLFETPPDGLPPALLPPLDLLLRPDELRRRLLPPLLLLPPLCFLRSIKSLPKSLSSNSIKSQSKSTRSRLLLLRPDERLLLLLLEAPPDGLPPALPFDPLLLRLDVRLRRLLLPAVFFLLLLCLFRSSKSPSTFFSAKSLS